MMMLSIVLHAAQMYLAEIAITGSFYRPDAVIINYFRRPIFFSLSGCYRLSCRQTQDRSRINQPAKAYQPTFCCSVAAKRSDYGSLADTQRKLANRQNRRV
ncbi:MAG: hypothetical protein ACI8RO_001170 [Flavobacteriales bacterium]|jgi:hypothetical protein